MLKIIYNEAARTRYGAHYVPDTLYISFPVTDTVQQRKQVINGLEIWIDPGGKKNKKTGILYPFNAPQHEMRLTEFKEELNRGQHNIHPPGIYVSFSFVKDTLFCQAQLPYNTLIESPDVHSRWPVGLIEKGSPFHFLGANPCRP